MSELVRLLESMRGGCGPQDGVVNTEDLNRAINLAKLQSGREEAAAGALQAAARLYERLVKIGRTPANDLTERQKEEWRKFAGYHHDNGSVDVPRWLRDLSAKTSKITPAREYGVACLFRGSKKWRMPSLDEMGSRKDALAELKQAQEVMGPASFIREAKIVSRTKAGPWEDEEA